MEDCFTLDQFQNFFYAKSFDIIGNGTYKKFLARSKEINDQWALSMSSDINVVQTKIKDIQNLVNDIPRLPNDLQNICKDVMSSAQPPMKMHAGTMKCILTQRFCNNALDFSRIIKEKTHAYVDARFGHFFLLLWYFNKIEYIIRSCVRHWLDMQQKDMCNKELCDKLFQDFHGKTEKMHKLCITAHQHISISLNHIINKQFLHPILHKVKEKKRD
jgi:hypothetical protein